MNYSISTKYILNGFYQSGTKTRGKQLSNGNKSKLKYTSFRINGEAIMSDFIKFYYSYPKQLMTVEAWKWLIFLLSVCMHQRMHCHFSVLLRRLQVESGGNFEFIFDLLLLYIMVSVPVFINWRSAELHFYQLVWPNVFLYIWALIAPNGDEQRYALQQPRIGVWMCVWLGKWEAPSKRCISATH